jgi:phosphoadenosine phosphosulfate reductase
MTSTEQGTRAASGRALVAEAADRYAAAGADEIVAWAATTFGDGLAVASSMADTVLPHLVARHLPGVDVLFLDTGYHFPETLDTRDEVERRIDVTIRDVRPRLSVAEQDRQWGADLFARDPAACCAMRKVEPLTESLGGYDAWVTGVRRSESPTRALTPVVEWDEAFGLVKVNPLAAWSDADVQAYLAEHDVPAHPLLSQGYPSIGCAPCTRRVADGQDARSGRWSGFAKTECGLHPTPTTDPAEETR